MKKWPKCLRDSAEQFVEGEAERGLLIEVSKYDRQVE